MSGDITQFLKEQKLHIFEERKRLGLLKEQNGEDNKENLRQNKENYGEIIPLEDGKEGKEALPEKERLYDRDKEKGILWDEDKENRLEKPGCYNHKNSLGVSRCPDNTKYKGDRREILEIAEEYGKERKEVLPEKGKVSDEDKERGILWDEDKENRLGKASDNRGKSAGSVLRCTENTEYKKDRREILQFKNVPSVVEPLDLTRCCYDLSLEDRKQALIDRFVNSEGPFSSRSDGAVGRAFAGGGVSFAPPTLRRGEYAPSSCTSLRAAPHEGLGEYEIRRGQFQERRKRDYLRHLAKKNHDTLKEVVQENVESRREESQKSTRSTNTEISVSSKIVQTDIQNINNELVVHYDNVRPFAASPEKRVTAHHQRTVTDELVDAALRSTKRLSPFRAVDQRLTSAQNDLLLLRAAGNNMDKPKGILSNRRTGSPRDRYTSELGQTSYTPSTFMDGFSYTERTDELERERLKRDTYQRELRHQIEEKRHLQAMRDDQDRRERELENKRLEQQLLRMQEEQMVEDQRRARRNELMRRHSDDLLRRKTEMHELQRPWRRHADSESGNLDSFGLGASPTTATYGGGGATGSHYSPPVSRRAHQPGAYSSYNVPATSVFPESNSSRYNHPSRYDAGACSTTASSSYGGILRKDTLKRIESLNSYDTVPLRSQQHSSRRFDRFDSLSRIDSLSHRLETMSVRDGDLSDVQRRHSATQQDLSHLRKSPRLRRRNSSSRFEDQLPVPMLKARSPVAKELKNAIPFSSHRSGDVQRRLEDRWQIPAVQKTILHPVESPSRGTILTQLGSIRAQLQREQLRMDESLRRRGLTRTRTTEDY